MSFFPYTRSWKQFVYGYWRSSWYLSYPFIGFPSYFSGGWGTFWSGFSSNYCCWNTPYFASPSVIVFDAAVNSKEPEDLTEKLKDLEVELEAL